MERLLVAQRFLSLLKTVSLLSFITALGIWGYLQWESHKPLRIQIFSQVKEIEISILKTEGISLVLPKGVPVEVYFYPNKLLLEFSSVEIELPGRWVAVKIKSLLKIVRKEERKLILGEILKTSEGHR